MTDFKKGEHKFYIGDADKPDAIIEYRTVNDKTIDIYHTAVSDQLGNQGMGTKLVEQVVDYANANNLTITASCSFARKVIEHFPEFKQFYAGKE